MAIVREQKGMTLIEVMVAMMIFLTVSSGIAGAMITGLRAEVYARRATFGKQEAEQRLEEMRARPYYVPYSTDETIGTVGDIDLLDRYYPNPSTTPTTDVDGWTGTYYPGTDAHYTRVSQVDEHGIITTVETRFVDSNNVVIVPVSTYDSNSAGNDTPPSELVDVIITTTWPDRSPKNTYTLESLISSTLQTPPVSESGCTNTSEAGVDVIGGILIAETGVDEPYTAILNGTLGEAHAAEAYPCSTVITASGTGGQMAIVDGSTYAGAMAAVSGPPDAYSSDGPVTVGPPSSYPKPTLSNTRASGDIEDENGWTEVEAEGEAFVGTQTLQLEGVSGTPSGTFSGYRRWDFLNPTITVTGGSGCDHGENIKANIEQEDGTVTGEAEIDYQQIDIMPLQKWPTDTHANPSAAQGVAFIRDFHASAHATTDGTDDGVSKSITYSFTLGMFNPNKSGCSYNSTGDSCYDLISVNQSNPLQNVSLGSSNYRLQNELFTEWHSYDSTEITNAMTVSPDNKTVTISADTPLVRISSKYGGEIKWKNANNDVTLVDQAGLQELGIGKIDISISRNG